MSDTIFHKILAGEIPCAKIYEDEHLFAFMDAFPQSKGHSLIIPKTFAPDLLTAHPESLQHIIVFSQKLARAQKKALAADGIKVVQIQWRSRRANRLLLPYAPYPGLGRQNARRTCARPCRYK